MPALLLVPIFSFPGLLSRLSTCLSNTWKCSVKMKCPKPFPRVLLVTDRPYLSTYPTCPSHVELLTMRHVHSTDLGSCQQLGSQTHALMQHDKTLLSAILLTKSKFSRVSGTFQVCFNKISTVLPCTSVANLTTPMPAIVWGRFVRQV